VSAVLRVRGLSKSYTQHLRDGRRMPVLHGLDLDVEPGSCVVVRGPSGSGKSSLLRCVYGSARCDSGSIAIGGEGESLDVATADERTILTARRTLVGMATQFLSVVPRVSAHDLVCAQGIEREAATGLLSRLGLPEELHDMPPATFSGGQRQLVNLALTLARHRPLVLLDEVTASLDPRRRELVFDELLERKARGVAFLCIFHDLPSAPGFVDRVVTLRDGRMVS